MLHSKRRNSKSLDLFVPNTGTLLYCLLPNQATYAIIKDKKESNAMTKRNYLFTSESVTPGHPDRVCDQIVENILGELLKQDPHTKAGIEGLLGKGFLTIAGEVTTEGYADIQEIARNVILDIGYDRAKYGLDGENVGVLNGIIAQSPEIAGGVFNSYESRNNSAVDKYDLQGAGDQGLLFGFSCKDNTDYHPAAHKLANLLAEKLYTERKYGTGKNILLPDGKTQVTLRYEEGKPVGIHTVLISTQQRQGTTLEGLREYIIDSIIKPVIKDYNDNYNLSTPLVDDGNYIVNPAGIWNIGASASDTGLVGRKVVSDCYGSYVAHGGGNINGKDMSKVDRSANYYGRYVAKNIVAAGLADELELQVAYGIGVARPLSLYVNSRGTAHVPEEKIEQIVNEVFDFRPLAIIEQLNVQPEAYKHTAQFGHYGRNPKGLFTWENLDKVKDIQSLV